MKGERGRGTVRALALGLGVAAIAVLAVLPSAAAKTSSAGGLQSLGQMTTPEIKSYLRSLGVNTRGLVIQRGERNYAGPSCPGRAWNCTTSTKVVQLSSSRTAVGAAADDDDENQFVCRRLRGPGSQTPDATPPDQSCVIVQGASSSNSATCDISTTSSGAAISQTCLITQGGTSNTAVARLAAVLRGNASAQDVDQRIEILQTGGGSGNTLTATQTARLERGGGDGDDDDGGGSQNAGGADFSSSQDFHQVVCTNQQASGAGRNSAKVTQNGRATIDLKNAGDVDIDQNTDQVPVTCLPAGPAAPYADIAGAGHNNTLCAVESDDFGFAKENANTCARVQQDSGTGSNSIEQRQSSRLDVAVDRADVVEIDQGSLLGGIDSTQDQESSGVSTNVDTQDADQLASVRLADSFDVNQIEDPRCCSDGHQLGNTGNSWSLGQDLLQRTLIDGEPVDPEDVEGGEVTQQGANFGNCTSAGSCAVTQRLQNNVETETNSCTGTSCDIFIDCAAAGGESESGGVCATEDDVEISNTASVSSETADPNTENNSDTETTLVLADDVVTATRARLAAPQAITPTTDAEALAGAIATQEGVVSSAVFAEVAQTETIVPHAVSDTELAGFPTNAETYAILTTGDASLAATEGGFADAQLGGAPVRGDTDRDVAVLQIDLDVPEGFNCLSFDFRFLSEEFPDFVGGNFNDAFIAELDDSTWTTSGSTITADDNFAFDPSGNVISINSTGVADMTADAAAGTVYGGATTLLRASTPITEGLHSLFLSIFDQGDMRYDSAVFLDNLILGTQTGEECEEGVEPVGEADLSVELSDSPDPVGEGDVLTYTITVSNDGPDEAEGVTLIDNLPELLEFGSAVPSQGSCTQVLAVSCDLGAIASGGSATVTITATPQL